MKLKAIAIITAIILIVSYVPVYADTVIPDPPDDDWEYWIICTHKDGTIMYFSSHNPITVTLDERYLNLNTCKQFLYRNGEWEFNGTDGHQIYTSFKKIYESNHDIAYEDGSGFFFVRPKVSPLYQGMKITDFGTIWRTFSVGLIPIIGCLILVISLRKGWDFLQTQLKH